MSLQMPDSMDECFYFTRRSMGEGKAIVWVRKTDCPSCGKAKMGKPVGDNGRVKIRSQEYVCPSCGHTIEKKEYEESLPCEIIYTCPHCKHEGEITVPYKRKRFKGPDAKNPADAVVFECESCGKKIGITKKMK